MKSAFIQHQLEVLKNKIKKCHRSLLVHVMYADCLLSVDQSVYLPVSYWLDTDKLKHFHTSNLKSLQVLKCLSNFGGRFQS